MNGWPLILRHADVTRLLARNTCQVVLTAKIKPGEYQVQDALVVRRNERYRKTGHFELQQDPTVRTIAITTINPTRLIDVDLRIVRAAGFKTQRDFYDDWLDRRGHIDPNLEILVCHFQTAEPIRLLHRRPHRGYTSNPRLAAAGEPEALSAADLGKLANAATQRYERDRQDEIARRQAASIRARRRQAEKDGDRRLVLRLSEELMDLKSRPRAA